MDIISIGVNTTLGETHDGAIIRVTSGITLTLPEEATHAYEVGDTFIIVADTASTVTIDGEIGTTLSPNGSETLTNKGEKIIVTYAGSEEYLLYK